MYFGSNTSVNPRWTKDELANSAKNKAEQKLKEKQDRINKLYEDIRYCNEKLNDLSFINSTTLENVKALVVFRIQLVTECDKLVNSI